jgi:hypothetical protein
VSGHETQPLVFEVNMSLADPYPLLSEFKAFTCKNIGGLRKHLERDQEDPLIRHV